MTQTVVNISIAEGHDDVGLPMTSQLFVWEHCCCHHVIHFQGFQALEEYRFLLPYNCLLRVVCTPSFLNKAAMVSMTIESAIPLAATPLVNYIQILACLLPRTLRVSLVMILRARGIVTV